MLKVSVTTKGLPIRTVGRVISLSDLSAHWRLDLNFLVRADDEIEINQVLRLRQTGLENLILLTASSSTFEQWSSESVLETNDRLQDEDVVAVADHMSHAHVLFRHSDQHHTVFLTNRCNSYCLMCSQPPSRHDDSWLVDEAIAVSGHIARAPSCIGFSGGEPLLLGDDLGIVLETFIARHSNTRFEVLTNGRLLGQFNVAQKLLKGLNQRVTWMVPLYGHADFLHDFVVQSTGAFEETLAGLLNLRRFEQPIQLRVVLIRPVLDNLVALCEFIGRNLPFVREVALMACEPIGFALANPELTNVDLREWDCELAQAVKLLARAKVPVILMNAPLCSLPKTLWPLAHKSISDWKRTFADECNECSVQPDCAGLFAWYKSDKHEMKIKKIPGIINV